MKKGVSNLLIKIYFLVLTIFFAFRLVLFFTQRYRVEFNEGKMGEIMQSLLYGFRFDLSITSYILILPALVGLIVEIFGQQSKVVNRIIFYWIFVFFSVTFLISAADIPYFNHFFSHFSIGAFSWAENPDLVAKMILEEPKFYLYIILAIVSLIIFYRLLSRIFAQAQPTSTKNIFLKIGKSILILVVIFFSLRGTIVKKTPLLVGNAYFCTDPLLNQLGLNPAYSFMRSYLDRVGTEDRPFHVMDDQLALRNVQKYLNVDTTTQYHSPIARKITPSFAQADKPNVVIILLESLTTAKMGRHGEPNHVTNFIDSLSYQSYYFDHLYSAGEHTFNGIFGTLFGLPSLYRQHTMYDVKEYNGISRTLQKLGYSTTFFMNHDPEFDNTEAFLYHNKFENIYSERNYPKEEIKTTWGVPDDFMFRYSMPIFDKLSEDSRPFFVTILTTSNHRPFFLPEYFKPIHDDEELQMTEYADWSLQRFMEMAQEKPWFDNTIFVFIADHGAALDVKYDLPLNYHHTPMLIYAPKLLKPKLFSQIAGQIDCFPTIMGIIQQPYINSTLGIDLLHEERPYIFINGDDKLGVLDNEFLLIKKPDNTILLHKYRQSDPKNYATDYPEKVKEMEAYMNANLQSFHYIRAHAHEFLD